MPERDTSDLKSLLMEILSQQNEMTNDKIQQQLRELNNVVSQLVGMNAMENVLANGFDAISAQLAPLRELAPQRKPLDEAGNALLANVRDSLRRPDWNGVNFLELDKPAGMTLLGETASGVYVAVDQRSTLS